MPEPTFVFTTPGGELFALLPDAVTREDHGISAVATEQEVERGIDTTDHIREEADRFGAEIVISNSPLRTIEGDEDHFFFGVVVSSQPLSLNELRGPNLDRLANAGPPARGVETVDGTQTLPTISTLQPEGPVARTAENWQLLEDAKSQGYLATIVTNTKTYRSMVLLSAEVTLTAEDGGWLRIEVLFGELRQVETEVVDASEPLQPRNQRQQNDGSQATPEEEAPPQSLASQGVDFIRGLF